MHDPGTEESFYNMLEVMFLTPEQREMKAPFPWFGGKSQASSLVWERFGNVPNYVEPFFGSGAVLLGRPHAPKIETVNDKDGFIANFWRALQHDPDAVAAYADCPVNENDLHARHTWLRAQVADFVPRLEADPDWYDVKIAGWWVWGMACWIGGGFCGDSGAGPWQVVDGRLVHLGDAGRGVTRRLVHLGNAGRGVKRQRVHLGDAGRGVSRQRVHLGSAGQGVSRQRVHLGNAGEGLRNWFTALAARLRFVRVCCGDWARIVGDTPTIHHGVTGVFLDPPYSAEAGRDNTLYREEDMSVAHDVRAWAIANGDRPLLRIAFCGYEGEHEMPSSWIKVKWKAQGGYANISRKGGKGKENRHREVIWFSPHCLAPRQPNLFEEQANA